MTPTDRWVHMIGITPGLGDKVVEDLAPFIGRHLQEVDFKESLRVMGFHNGLVVVHKSETKVVRGDKLVPYSGEVIRKVGL